MITGFEEHTAELTSEEMEILPLVIHGFRNYKKNNPIKAELIVTRMNEFLLSKGYKIKMSQLLTQLISSNQTGRITKNNRINFLIIRFRNLYHLLICLSNSFLYLNNSNTNQHPN